MTLGPILYPSFAVDGTAPAHLGAQAVLAGLCPPKIEQARILEIGCASGGNLLPLAAWNPSCEFVGCDPAEAEIDLARERARDANLTRIHFEACGVEELPEELGCFDYIICHGVYSWVPSEIREKIWACFSERLVPGGLACVSYNVFPGFHLRQMVRDMLLNHCQHMPDPHERHDSSKELLRFLVEGIGEAKTTYRAALQDELNILEKTGTGYVNQEHFAENNQAFYVDELLKAGEKNGLHYVSDADHNVDNLSAYPRTIAQRLGQIHDHQSRLRYQDYITGRSFRSSIFCKTAQMSPEIEWSRLWVGMPHIWQLKKSADKFVCLRASRPGQSNPEVTLTDPRSRQLIDFLNELAPGAISLTNLAERLSFSSLDELGLDLARLQNLGLVRLRLGQLHADVTDPQARIHPFCRFEARTGHLLTNAWHTSITLEPEYKSALAAGSEGVDLVNRLRAQALLLPEN